MRNRSLKSLRNYLQASVRDVPGQPFGGLQNERDLTNALGCDLTNVWEQKQKWLKRGFWWITCGSFMWFDLNLDSKCPFI